MEEEPDPVSRETTDQDPNPVDPPAEDPLVNEVPTGMNLEIIISLTGELAHLNELVILHLEKAGGFTCQESYFTIVTPVLDLLEGEIRFRYYAGMSKDQMKLVVQDWIDKEIGKLKGSSPDSCSQSPPEDSS